MRCFPSVGVEIVIYACILNVHRCKGTTERDVIGQFCTTDAAVDVMERPADSPPPPPQKKKNV